MSQIDRMHAISKELDSLASEAERGDIVSVLKSLESSATSVGKAWSGSCIGYHADIYYRGFKPPPTHAQFSPEWGLDEAVGMGSSGDWVICNGDEVVKLIYKKAGNPDVEILRSLGKKCSEVFADYKEELISFFINNTEDAFVKRQLDKLEEMIVYSEVVAAKAILPKGQYSSRDSRAIHQGLKIPPHHQVLATVMYVRAATRTCKNLSQIASLSAKHLVGKESASSRGMSGNKIFIGHGRSNDWKELKDFLQDRLGLEHDEFNRVPIAGVTNIERLNVMLDNASFAFLLMTAEDEQRDGTVNARQNVIHEAGLFQGRLGFSKAIVVLEDGCEEFSNIQGLGQLRYKSGDFKGIFEDIRMVLEREKILD